MFFSTLLITSTELFTWEHILFSGIGAMIGMVGYGAYSYRHRGNQSTSVFLMHLRVKAQSMVVGAMTIGVAASLINELYFQKKDDKWIPWQKKRTRKWIFFVIAWLLIVNFLASMDAFVNELNVQVAVQDVSYNICLKYRYASFILLYLRTSCWSTSVQFLCGLMETVEQYMYIYVWNWDFKFQKKHPQRQGNL